MADCHLAASHEAPQNSSSDDSLVPARLELVGLPCGQGGCQRRRTLVGRRHLRQVLGRSLGTHNDTIPLNLLMLLSVSGSSGEGGCGRGVRAVGVHSAARRVCVIGLISLLRIGLTRHAGRTCSDIPCCCDSGGSSRGICRRCTVRTHMLKIQFDSWPVVGKPRQSRSRVAQALAQHFRHADSPHRFFSSNPMHMPTPRHDTRGLPADTGMPSSPPCLCC